MARMYLGTCVLALTLPLGCADPLSRDATTALREQLIQSQRRQIEAAGPGRPQKVTPGPQDTYLNKNPERLKQLDLDTGPEALDRINLDHGPALNGEPTDVVSLSLEQAIRIAVRNNLDIRLGRLAPAIAEADVAAAEAAFDAVFFSEGSWSTTDRPQPRRLITDFSSGVPVTTPVGTRLQVSENGTLTTGIRKPLETGGTLTAASGFEFIDNRTPRFGQRPDPAWNSNIFLRLEQPLLKNFGTDINRAQIYISRNAQRREVLRLHKTLLETVAAVEEAYWNLVFARRSVAIRQELLRMTRETRDILIQRERLDVTSVQTAQAQSFVGEALAAAIAARQAARAASDRLKQLLQDPSIPLAGETMIVPTDQPVELPVEYNLLDAVTAALRNRPETRAAILDIDDRSIRQKVFDNQRLPDLKLNAQIQYNGMNDNGSGLASSYDNLLDGDFIEYLIGGQFEVPIGNRAARANYRKTQIEKHASILAYRIAARDVLADVKNQLREQQRWYENIAAARAQRRSAGEWLRSLTQREQKVEGLGAEFILDQKLRSQQALAGGQINELEAIVRYNIALMNTRRAQGTLLEYNNIELSWPRDMFADE